MPIPLQAMQEKDRQLEATLRTNALWAMQASQDNEERQRRNRSKTLAPRAENCRVSTKKPTPSAPKKLNECKCGCGEPCKKSFRPGHDGRFYGRLKKVYEGDVALEDADPVTRAAVARGEMGHGSLFPRWNILAGQTPEKK